MSFLNPLFLFALAAVGLPLLIHLLNIRRPQRVKFSTLAFFRELKNTTIRRIRIKSLLLLLLRLLAVACLAMVLARPFLPPGLTAGGSAQAPALNAILLDNSISMERIGANGPLFDYAKTIIRDIEESAKDDDRFLLQTTNGEAGPASVTGHAGLLQNLGRTQIRDAGNYTAIRLADMLEAAEESPYANKRVFILGDGQSTQLNESQLEEEYDLPFTFIDVGDTPVQNTVIRSVSSETSMVGSDIPFEIKVTLGNPGAVQAVNQFLSLRFNGEPAGQYNYSLDAGEEQEFTFTVNPVAGEPSVGEISIEGDEFSADNTRYFSVKVPGMRSVLWVEETGNESAEFSSYTGVMLEAAGENDAQLNYTRILPDAFSGLNLSDYDAVILDGLNTIPAYMFDPLQNFIQSGKGLLFFPSENADLSGYNDFLSRFNAGSFIGFNGEYASFMPVGRGTELLEDHPAFSGLFERDNEEDLVFTEPEIYYYLKLDTRNSSGSFDLLKMNNGDPLLHEKKFGEGVLMIAAVGNDPGWSDFPLKALYTPLYYRSILYASSSDEGGLQEHKLGSPFVWTGNIASEEAELLVGSTTVKPETDVVAEGIELSYPAREWTPGFVTVKDETISTRIALNREEGESDFTEADDERFKEWFGDNNWSVIRASGLEDQTLGQEIRTSGFGQEVWHWFMLAGFLLLIAETLLSVWYRTDTL